MKLKLKKLPSFCGPKASFYTVIVDEKEARFATFIQENESKYKNELLQMVSRLKAMANETGALDIFFKLNESANPEDKKIVCYYDVPDANFRLFCIKMSDNLVVLGGGGPKPWYHFKWQHNAKLNREGEFIMLVSETIDLKMQHGELEISPNGLFFTGNLELT